MKVLHIDSSPFIESSISRMVSAEIVAAMLQQNPHIEVVCRDVGINPPTHLSAAVMNTLHNGNDVTLNFEQLVELDEINQAITELMTCDAVVIGSPMYNHSISSNLKAWLDQISQAGKTFRYTVNGPIGLVPNKPVYVASSRGGIYSEGHNKQHDFQEPYLISILSLLGLTDVTVVRAEGVSISANAKEKALTKARHQITELFS